MPSWSQPSPESAGPSDGDLPPAQGADDLRIMRRAFVEALRRAEIVALLSGATSERELGRLLPEELCEVYDAEVGLLVEVGDAPPAREIGIVGVHPDQAAGVLGAGELTRALSSARAVSEQGSDLLGVGARNSLLCCFRTADGRRVLVGVARLYPKPFDEVEVALIESVATSTGQTLERIWAYEERDELISQLKASLVGTAEALANALEAKDDYTANHASEVADLAVEVGRRLGLTPGELEDLRYGAIFHDVGKIAIPDAILHKPGPLDPEERRLMMRHPEIGAEIVAPIPFLSPAVKQMVRHDHEHFDGSGYPDGLAGEAIPIGARIILVVDGYHAMISDRPYRKAMAKPEALAEIARNTGRQFDPLVVAAFVEVVG
jgi:putative nucleotidyltransferase with HDIG domain